MKKMLKAVLAVMLLIGSGQLLAQDDCEPCTEPANRYADKIYNGGFNVDWNVVYSTDPWGVRTFDYYTAGEECERRPLVVVLPGSGFELLDLSTLQFANIKTNIQSILKAHYFVSRGYNVAVVDYFRIHKPCYNEKVMNTVIHMAAQDVNAAIQFMVGQAAHYKIDPDHIFVLGESAGGVAGLSALFSDMNGQLLDAELQPSQSISIPNPALNARTMSPYQNVSYNVRAFAGISTGVPTIGIFNNRARHIDIPLIFFHGTGDTQVPMGHAHANACPALQDKFCGSGCIADQIDEDPNSTNCHQSYLVYEGGHDIINYHDYHLLYLREVRDFFYDRMFCLDCENSVEYFENYDLDEWLTKKEQSPLGEVSNEAISIFPNPADSEIQISGLESATVITVTDLLGKVVFVETINGKNSTIDVSDWQPGVYLISLQSDSVSTAHKVIVQ